MKNPIFIVLILAMGALLFGCTGSSQNNTTGQTGSLHGKIADLNGVPLANVRVGATSGDLYYSTRTDSDGTYSISDMLPGKYSVDAFDLDYELKTGEVTIVKGESYTWSAALAPFGEIVQQIPFNDTQAVTEPEKAFAITNCTPMTYDFYPGYEDLSAGLNCTFTPIACSRGDSYDKWVLLTLFGPDGAEISNESFCLDSSKMIRMTKKPWTTPDKGRYTLTAEMYGSGKRLYEYNMTFKGQSLTLVPELFYPAGDLVYDKYADKYFCHDDSREYIGFKMRYAGDLPLFTDRMAPTIDGKSVITGVRYINGDPGNGTTDKIGLTCGSLTAGSHILEVKTYNNDNLVSDDTLMFNIPR